MTAPAKNICLNVLDKEYNVIGRKAKIENGQPRITPVAATATAIAGLPRRNNPEERLMAYIENELGKKPGNHTQNKGHHKTVKKEKEFNKQSQTEKPTDLC